MTAQPDNLTARQARMVAVLSTILGLIGAVLVVIAAFLTATALGFAVAGAMLIAVDVALTRPATPGKAPE